MNDITYWKDLVSMAYRRLIEQNNKIAAAVIKSARRIAVFFTPIAPIGILQVFEAPEGRVLRNEAHSRQSEAHATAKSSVGRCSTLGFLWTYPCD